MGAKLFAAIDVGSFELSMKIYQFSAKAGHMEVVDHIRRSLDIGTDTYAQGKISPAKMEILYKTLEDFAKIMHSYGVDAYKAYATSALREAKNRLITIDQLRQHTGLDIEILSNSEQRFMGYKSVVSKGEGFRQWISHNAAIVDMGGGSMQISLFDNGRLSSTQNVRLGILRLQERLGHITDKSGKLETMAQELAQASFATYRKLHAKERDVDQLILVDEYISPWASRQGEAGWDLDAGLFLGLPEELKSLSQAQIAYKMGVEEEKAPLVFLSALLFRCLIQMLGSKKIWAPGVSLGDGMAYAYGERIGFFKGGHDFEADILACAQNTARRYKGSRRREETLEHIGLVLFDAMKKAHGLGKRERLYLRLAAYLHDCGKFISMVNIGESSFNIIMATEMIGLSHREREIVAQVVRFNHSPFSYFNTLRAEGSVLDQASYMTVAKLTALLQLANSLDRSHRQKMRGLKAQLKDNRLWLKPDTKQDISLERAYLELGKGFFREVYGIEPVIVEKRNV